MVCGLLPIRFRSRRAECGWALHTEATQIGKGQVYTRFMKFVNVINGLISCESD